MTRRRCCGKIELHVTHPVTRKGPRYCGKTGIQEYSLEFFNDGDVDETFSALEHFSIFSRAIERTKDVAY